MQRNCGRTAMHRTVVLYAQADQLVLNNLFKPTGRYCAVYRLTGSDVDLLIKYASSSIMLVSNLILGCRYFCVEDKTRTWCDIFCGQMPAVSQGDLIAYGKAKAGAFIAA